MPSSTGRIQSFSACQRRQSCFQRTPLEKEPLHSDSRARLGNLGFWTVLLIVGWLAGCVTPSADRRYHDLSEIEQPFVLGQAWRLPDGFVFRFQRGSAAFQGRALSAERPAMTIALPIKGFDTVRLLPLSYAPVEQIAELNAAARALPVLGAEQWRRLRDRLFRQLIPEEHAGLVLEFQYASYFLYYDKAGVFQAVPLVQKPAGYRAQGSLDIDRLVRESLPRLIELLDGEGIKQQEFVFATGDTGIYALPFLYVNLATEELVFFQDESLVEDTTPVLPGIKTTEALAHVLRSHMSDILQRPFSSLYRLVVLAADTMLTTLRFDWTIGLADNPLPPLSDAAPMDLVEWEAELDRMMLRKPVTGSVDILVDGEQFFPRFVARIQEAESSIYLQTYIFDDDDFAVQIGQLLKQRSNEGIDVKVLFDGFGTIGATMSQPATLPLGHEPPLSVKQFLKAESNIQVRSKTNPWMTSDHVKNALIDNQVAFIGGMNIGREYRYEWHDLMMELTGPVVDQLAHEFEQAWVHAGPFGDIASLFAVRRPVRYSPAGEPLRILLTAPGNLEIYTAQIEAARRAKDYVYIQNAYFTDDRMLRELVMARRRGVDVRVIIPIETDHGPISRSNVLAANLMIENGIRVYIYPGFSHVKAALFDGWACLGSANFDRLSLRINRELNIASSSPLISGQLLERVFDPDFAASPELTEAIPSLWVDYLVEIIADYLY